MKRLLIITLVLCVLSTSVFVLASCDKKADMLKRADEFVSDIDGNYTLRSEYDFGYVTIKVDGSRMELIQTVKDAKAYQDFFKPYGGSVYPAKSIWYAAVKKGDTIFVSTDSGDGFPIEVNRTNPYYNNVLINFMIIDSVMYGIDFDDEEDFEYDKDDKKLINEDDIEIYLEDDMLILDSKKTDVITYIYDVGSTIVETD